MCKTIFVIWNFKDFILTDHIWSVNSVNYKEYKVDKCPDCQLIAIQYPNNASMRQFKLTMTFVKKKVKATRGNILVLWHNKPHDYIIQIKKAGYILFHGGDTTSHAILYDNLISSVCLFRHDALTKDKNICKDNFFNVWNYYCHTKPIEDFKKKLIHLWLPLAIDVQGLHDVDEVNRNKYLKELNSGDYLSYYQNEWDTLSVELQKPELEPIFNNDDQLEFDPMSVVDAIKEDKLLVFDDKKETCLLNWLRHTIDQIDQLI